MEENKSKNAIVKDPVVRCLLDRRAEILETINKLQAEYSAIEKVLVENHRLKEELSRKKDDFER